MAEHSEPIVIAKSVTPVAISASTVFFGIQLDAWVLIVTGVYAVVQLGLLIVDRIERYRRKKHEDMGKVEDDLV